MAENVLKQTHRTADMLANISRGVAIILWVVLTQALVWPIASVYSSYQDAPLLSTNVLFVSSIIAMVVSFGVTRFVFPINYETVESTEESDDQQNA